MKVFKFGGASVKDQNSICNLIPIVSDNKEGPLVVIASAMGKTTNGLEGVLQNYLQKKDWKTLLKDLLEFHINIANSIISPTNNIFTDIEKLFNELSEYIHALHGDEEITKIYSHVVAHGELLSTKIITAYFNEVEIDSALVDARELVKTDSNYVDAHVNWVETSFRIKEIVIPLTKEKIVVTQGFIGSNIEGDTTTLGREGSDFSGAIFAHCLMAKSLTVWKDVPGILTADPKLMSDAQLLPKLSYKEASEMTFYGAKVIHAKTIRPLYNANIDLFVKPFLFPNQSGSLICGEGPNSYPPIFILKRNQTLISFIADDLGFINERKMGVIFHALHELNIKVNLMENSAVSFSICVDTKFDKVDQLMENLSTQFKIAYNKNLELFTIKNYDEKSLLKMDRSKIILLEQKSRKDIHVLYEATI